jgi:sulfur-carrier protein
MIIVRYFAAAAEAAGVDSESFDTESVDTETVDTETVDTESVDTEPFGNRAHGTFTAGALRRAMVAAHGSELERVLARCSLLAAGRRLPDDDAAVPDGVTVDVLPPFAGG